MGSGNANRGELDDEAREALGYMTGLKIGRGYARLFNLPEITFIEAAEYYGYTFDTLQDHGGESARGIDWPSRRHLLKKWAKDFALTPTRLRDLPAYLTPVEPL